MRTQIASFRGIWSHGDAQIFKLAWYLRGKYSPRLFIKISAAALFCAAAHQLGGRADVSPKVPENVVDKAKREP